MTHLPGAITHGIDVTQLVLAGFIVFFIGLVIHLRREDKREGYPLIQPPPSSGPPVEGFPRTPPPKVFLRMNGEPTTMPHREEQPPMQAVAAALWPGAPLLPVGDPMLAAVGPGSYAMKEEKPLEMLPGEPQVLPLRVLPKWHVSAHDTDPRGMAVFGADGILAGRVIDLWVDRSVKILRYLELEVADGRRLLPIYYADIRARKSRIHVQAILSAQFATVPALAAPDHITAREEDRVNAYYAGGLLYATPQRSESLL